MTTKRDKKKDAKAAEGRQATPRLKDLVLDEAGQRGLTGGNSNLTKKTSDTSQSTIANMK